ncbi:uncharacterized protein TNCV_1277561 [Trichonephila clavipes]|nr:uncharacterized protein TNCV_1277561 [Trichonephila clavipes]
MAYDAESCGFQMLNDDEIVTFVQKESDPVDDETNEDVDNNNNKSSKGPSMLTRFLCYTAMEWYEQQSECCSTQLQLLKRIRDLAAEKRRCTMPHSHLRLAARRGRHIVSIENLKTEKIYNDLYTK